MFSFDFGAVKKSLQGLQSRMSTLRTELTDLQRERQALHLAPTSREDVKSLVSEWVRAGGAEHATAISETIEKMARNPHAMAVHQQRAKQLVSFGAVAAEFDGGVDMRDIGKAICFVFGKQIEEALVRTIDAMDWPANQVSTAKRNASIKELDTRITANEREQEEITSKAAEIGINLGVE